MNTNLMMISLGSYVIHRFLKRLEAPYLDMFLEDKIITLPKLKSSISLGICIFGGIYSINNIIS